MSRIKERGFLATALLAACLVFGLATAAALPAHAAVSKPAKPTISSVKAASSTSVKVTVKKVSKARGYQMRVSTKSTMSGAKYVTTTKTTATIKGLKNYTKYYAQARAYKVSKGKKVWGSWGSKKTVRTLCAHPASKRVTKVTLDATCTEIGAEQTKCGVCAKALSVAPSTRWAMRLPAMCRTVTPPAPPTAPRRAPARAAALPTPWPMRAARPAMHGASGSRSCLPPAPTWEARSAPA
ncbi:MAG: fibronectin type III domain-containing protein [Coriobacteriia bacterium]|nr:fibronectin type III domain-containing protein [Coriobacteriia bacterium]